MKSKTIPRQFFSFHHFLRVGVHRRRARRPGLKILCVDEVSELVCFRLQGENALRLVQGLVCEDTGARELPLETFVAANLDTGGEVRGKLF
jgi:hypothetical protein